MINEHMCLLKIWAKEELRYMLIILLGVCGFCGYQLKMNAKLQAEIKLQSKTILGLHNDVISFKDLLKSYDKVVSSQLKAIDDARLKQCDGNAKAINHNGRILKRVVKHIGLK